MKKIDQDIVMNIIKDVRKEYDVKNKNFEIFVIKKILEMPVFNEKYPLTAMRTSFKNKPIILQDVKSRNIEAYFDADEQEFKTAYHSRKQHHAGDKVYEQFEMDLIRAYYNLLNDNKTFEELKKAMPEFIKNHGAIYQIKAIEHLEDEDSMFEKLIPLTNLIRLETELNDHKPDEIDFANNWLQEAEIVYNIDVVDHLFKTVYENSLYPNKSARAATLMNYKESSFDNKDEDFNKIGLAILKDIENYYNPKDSDELTDPKKNAFVTSDFVRNNTITGIVVDPDLNAAETAKKVFSIHYEQYRKTVKEELENIALTKSLEEIYANLPIQEVLDRIIKIYPDMNKIPSSELNYDINIGVLPNTPEQAHKDMVEIMNDINKVGFIDDLTYADRYNLFRHPENLLEIKNDEKSVTFTISDESEVLFKYIFLEKDYYGLKVLSPKTLYMRTGTSREQYDLSVDMLADYAYMNQCLIHARSSSISTDTLFFRFENKIEQKYNNEILYIGDSVESDEYLNILMNLKKELGENIKHKDLAIILTKLNKMNIYDKSTTDIYNEALNQFKLKEKIKLEKK